jgi:hypothetical protein
MANGNCTATDSWAGTCEYNSFGLLSKYVLVPIVIVMAIRSRVALNREPLSKKGILKIIKAVKNVLYNWTSVGGFLLPDEKTLDARKPAQTAGLSGNAYPIGKFSAPDRPADSPGTCNYPDHNRSH